MKPRVRLGVFVFVAFVIAWGSWLSALMWPSVPKALPLVGLFGPALATTDFGPRLHRIDRFDRGTWLTFVVLVGDAGVALLPAIPRRGHTAPDDTADVVLGNPASVPSLDA